MIDYRVLLGKYMKLVAENEGVTFIDDRPGPTPGDFPDSVGLTAEEYHELQAIDRELWPGAWPKQ